MLCGKSGTRLCRFGAPTWLAVIMGVWGAVATAFAGLRTPAQFYVLRLLLGAAEAGKCLGLQCHPVPGTAMQQRLWPCHQQVHCSLHQLYTDSCNEHLSNMGGLACHFHEDHAQATSLGPPMFCLQEPSPGCGERARPVSIPAPQIARPCCAQMLMLDAWRIGPVCVAKAVASRCCAGFT